MNAMRIPALLLASMAAAVPASPAWAQSYGYGRGYVAPPEEPPYVQYMSPRCRTLHHSLRARTVSSYQVIDGMRREYRRDCEETHASATTTSAKMHAATSTTTGAMRASKLPSSTKASVPRCWRSGANRRASKRVQHSNRSNALSRFASSQRKKRALI